MRPLSPVDARASSLLIGSCLNQTSSRRASFVMGLEKSVIIMAVGLLTT